MKTIKDKIYFDNDDEFEAYAIIPNIVAVPVTFDNGVTAYVQDFNFTDTYKKAIENGTRFIICDDNSKIAKRGCVTVRLCSKPVENLDPYTFGVKKMLQDPDNFSEEDEDYFD